MSNSDDFVFDPRQKFVSSGGFKVPPKREVAQTAAKAFVQQQQDTSTSFRPEVNSLSDNVVESNPVVPSYVPEPIKEREQRSIDSTYEDVFLPSGFVSYDFSQIAVRRLNVEDLRAIVRARVSGSMRHLLRAIDNTLSVSAYDLTVGDFWWLMYWHRLNSYKKAPFMVTWSCTNPKHLQMVEDKTVEPKTISQLTTIQKTDLKVVKINEEKYKAVVATIFQEYNVHVQPQTMLDFLADMEEEELIGLRKQKEAEAENSENDESKDEIAIFFRALETNAEDESRDFMIRYASMLNPVHGKSLSERVAFLEKQSPDLLIDMEELLEVSDHGVIEKFNCKCSTIGCGASRVIEQTLDALSFLPEIQRRGSA